MKKNVSIETIKKGKIYAEKRCLEKKCGKLKKRIEELEVALCYAQRNAE